MRIESEEFQANTNARIWRVANYHYPSPALTFLNCDSFKATRHRRTQFVFKDLEVPAFAGMTNREKELGRFQPSLESDYLPTN
ncbi:MAG: hypothetical protein B7X75_03685 [Sphingobacteriales bacterium 39-40-5]|nr:MAG: hypothetical protein B7X75_03685 [Sphingobacteriales bacterium 39-40-5]